ncbi:MAG: cytochrome c oxidase subunit I [Methanobacteriota archaeon]|nr:MAG: cytochrome c oxidase subunit I [Euryarchaeota archaeon]
MATETKSYWFLQPKTFFGTIDHKRIGMLYMMFAAINFAFAGYLALMMRTELFNPGVDFIKPRDWGSYFTVHGFVMIFFVIMAMGAGMGNYLVPKMIGAKDLYWPRWNNIAFWMLVPASVFVWMGNAPTGWTLYPPLSLTRVADNALNYTLIGLIIAGTSSVIGAINFLLTIIYLRRPGLTWKELDLFSWSIVFMAFIQLAATPAITIGLVMQFLANVMGGAYFETGAGSSSLFWQHVFWTYSHPAVYIMILPAMGLTSMLISRFSQAEVFGKTSMILSMGAITLLGFLVWGHHNFTASPNSPPGWFFTFTTFLIAIPSGIKTFNWILTMYKGKIVIDIPLLFALGFVLGFVLGGVTGVMVNTIPLDLVFHDTYFVVGHFHFIIIGGAISALSGTMYFLYPDMTGRMYNKTLAYVHFVLWIVGYVLTFGAMNVLGALGMPRRYIDYSVLDILPNYDMIVLFNRIATIGAYTQALAITVFFVNFVYSAFRGPPAGDRPYDIAIPRLWLEEEELKQMEVDSHD